MAGSVGTKLTPGQHVYECFASKDNIYQKCDVIALKGYCLTRLGLANKNVSRFEIVTLYSVIFLKVKFYIPNIFHRRKYKLSTFILLSLVITISSLLQYSLFFLNNNLKT